MVKSASIGIVGTGNKLIGIICLNCYLSTPFAEVLESFTVPANIVDVKSRYLAVNNNGYDTILSETINSAKDDVMSDPDIPYKLKKKEIIRRLHDSGVFQIKGGVAMCAEILGVTITTIYMHIRNLNAANGSTQHTDKQEEPIKQDK
jgi:predicted transcriptional regulator YheO